MYHPQRCSFEEESCYIYDNLYCPFPDDVNTLTALKDVDMSV